MQAHRGKWIHVVAVIALLAAISIVSLAIAAEKQDLAKESSSTDAGAANIAVVNGVAITRAEFDTEMDSIKQQFLAMGQPMPEERVAQMEKEVLENLISTELLFQAAQQGSVKVETSEVDEKYASLKKRFPSEEEFSKALEKMHLTEAGLRAKLERGMIIEELIDREIVQKIPISDEEIKTYYESNPALFTQPERVQASHILLKVDKNADASQKEMARKKGEEIQQKLKNGEDFAALAKEFSQCPSSAKGGDLGLFRRGQMVKPFEDAAFSMNPGDISDIVETQFGYHIIKVTDKKPEAVMPFEDVKDRLTQFLKQEKVQTEVSQYIEKLRAEAKIQDNLNPPAAAVQPAAVEEEKK
ncbi:MAG: peptidylprolyl isomerase [Candidatus Abyssobacteria bacterium SURF_5]|uniref:Peptidylprolyl isomerase n=1 Tax=Abyssobacteria bacterium (strain SURF_5) TaxID=2093360 RepID=A0A3A4NYY8_ABYX5|nr:MAG: peptidylprolyl isomerase [Candidatus Abyssubacteria bacterium SURF_5]